LRFTFVSKKLQKLYTDEVGSERYPPAVVEAFFDKMAVIAAASHENDLRTLKSLHMEKLKGKRGNRGEHSLRLNQQYRLTFTIETDDQGKLLRILNIEDYH
jgi:proteic killer suppression protein